MAYLQTGAAHAASFFVPHAPAAPLRAQRPSLFKRVLDALVQSRLRAAQREINAKAYLFDGNPPVLVELARVALADDAKLPFNR
jgi:hypothetical protein